ncbi:MAG: ribosomal protein S3, small subunit ribosomal protein S3 [Microgenomates group bacterium GW2011_GWC1_41_20]|uniref:Small ribosomal subunit protein uS3 n=8 Tax=root TaxID=1 RepID=A0A0G0RU91_9BACT|nr:30S ribosomal protein S3 [uncultured organism]KKR44955.1 MAG: 30S ribosomal protein S3 [Candidatus Woesebacteria bacterium GW2011_GWB1_40_12]KKR56244.1 MAG: 30S ribosomal protein S3 [Candidatus Woesebacteria bacterium GW2011_GWF1_40_24]KKR90751.1 MAG: 30S ribosomal protein S3 [Candidatus Woesebacteria bacterium GW2011_GWD1_41_12]KKS00777.1 MAG: ribosomal protein S3, small subunit ribosomal protein S3 [Microgenomates group bacterium GW2011_GWC1_41_20]KKS05784.1 MAG: 30S ribosomal protein S3 
MGQKVNPIGIRIGTFLPWKSRWFADSASFKNFLIEDIRIREQLTKKLKLAGITSVEIERLPKSMVVTITVSRPGVVIGHGGTGIEDVKKFILKIMSDVRKKTVKDLKIDIRINEVKNPELSAYLIADRIAGEMERRIPHRRVVQKAIERVMAGGALGIKVVLAGRINGAEISRVESFHQGSVPSQTLRENIDYAQIPALLKRGYVGVKVWIHKKQE